MSLLYHTIIEMVLLQFNVANLGKNSFEKILPRVSVDGKESPHAGSVGSKAMRV